MEKKIKVGELLSFAWETFKANPVQHILVLLLAGAVQQLADLPVKLLFANDPYAFAIASMLVSMTVGVLVGIFMISYAILQVRKSEESVLDIVKSVFDFELWWKYLLASIISGVIVMLGLLLLVVPGVIAALGLIFVSYIVVDYKMNPVDAVKKSWEMSNGYKWDLFILVIALAVLNALGALALFIGLLVTIPISMFVVARVYDILSSDESEQDKEEYKDDEEEEEDEKEEEDEQEEESEEDESLEETADEAEDEAGESRENNEEN